MSEDDDLHASDADDEESPAADDDVKENGAAEREGGAWPQEGAELAGEGWSEGLRRDEPAEEAERYEEDPEEEEEEEERERGVESVTIEITGLSLYTHHGVSDAEREVGQRLMLDLRLELGESDATLTDRVEDTVDYGEVCQLVALIAQQRSHRTLERLCSTVADRLLADYELEAVWVKATKPEPPIPLSVDEVSVEVWREAEE
jgi:dihydroneopterin aldolase